MGHGETMTLSPVRLPISVLQLLSTTKFNVSSTEAKIPLPKPLPVTESLLFTGCGKPLSYEERGFDFSPFLQGKRVRGLGFPRTFPHDVKSQNGKGLQTLIIS
jgi:hypothetical protein